MLATQIIMLPNTVNKQDFSRGEKHVQKMLLASATVCRWCFSILLGDLGNQRTACPFGREGLPLKDGRQI